MSLNDQHKLNKYPSQAMLDYIAAKYLYDPTTGILYRRTKSGLLKAGSINQTGYISICITHKKEKFNTLAHRVAWYLYTGSLPSQTIDHIDGDKTNNKINNLRECSHAQNRGNSSKINRPSKNNRPQSKYKGVRWDGCKNKPWQANIANTYIGHYATDVEAAAAYNQAALAKWGEFAKLNEIKCK